MEEIKKDNSEVVNSKVVNSEVNNGTCTEAHLRFLASAKDGTWKPTAPHWVKSQIEGPDKYPFG